MKISNIFVVSIVIAASQILNMSLSNGQTSNFSCENLSRYGLEGSSSDCLQNKPANNTSNSNTNLSKDSLNISKAGVLAINVQGKKSSFFIKDIEIYKDGIKASVVDGDGSIYGSINFIAKSGIKSGLDRLLNIESVILLTNQNNDITKVKEGSCMVRNLGYPGKLLGAVGFDKFTMKPIFNYATSSVHCTTLDNIGYEMTLTGLVIVEKTKD